MRTFAIVNRKGGVGKTTTAVELAFILATSCKQRVLFVDADSQGNATSMMLASGQDPSGAGLAAALEYPIEYYPDIIWRTDYEGLDIIPAGIDAYSTTGMAGLVRQIDNIRQACPQIRVAGVLVTQWRRSSIGEDAVQTLREESPVPIFRTVIRRTDKVVESSWSREPVGALSPFSAASRDYRTWVAELLEREGVANNA